MSDTLIQMSHICKAFPGVKALDDVSFDLRAGEVHALIGENGAGKSTLMKVLTGVYSCDSGEIRMNGKPVTINNVRDAQSNGIVMIHQELNLMNHLSAAENIYIGRECKKAFPLFLDKQKQNAKAKKIFEDLNLDIDPAVRVGDLTVAKQQMVEIAGLVGAGRTETARAVFGADPHESGTILVNGKEVNIKSPSDAIRSRIAYLSEDRKQYGLVLGLDVDINIALPNMGRFHKSGFIKFAKSEENSRKQTEKLAIKTPSIKQQVKLLSGGNQQKVVLAKWLTRDSDILIFDEPTRGIDIGPKMKFISC